MFPYNFYYETNPIPSFLYSFFFPPSQLLSLQVKITPLAILISFISHFSSDPHRTNKQTKLSVGGGSRVQPSCGGAPFTANCLATPSPGNRNGDGDGDEERLQLTTSQTKWHGDIFLFNV